MAFDFVLRIASLFSVFFMDRVQADLQSTCSSVTTAQWNYFFEGSCYVAHGSSVDWTMNYFEAAQSCNDIPGLQGHLAVFPDDFASMFPYMPYVFTVAADFTLFLGLRRQGPIVADDPDKYWFWVFPDGSRNVLGPGFWIEGQPDQSTVNETKTFGVFMRRGSSFGLGAHDSSPTNGYVCQYDPVRVTGSIPAGASPPPPSPSPSPEPEASTTPPSTTPQILPTSKTTSSMAAQTTSSKTETSKTAQNPPIAAQTTTQNTSTLARLVGVGQAGQAAPPKNKADFAGYSTIIIILTIVTVAAISHQDYDQT